MRTWARLVARGSYAGAALLGGAVVVLGGARGGLVLALMALGVLLQAIADAWGVAAAAPLAVLGLVFTAGGPLAVASLALVSAAVLAVVPSLSRGRRRGARPGEEP